MRNPRIDPQVGDILSRSRNLVKIVSNLTPAKTETADAAVSTQEDK